ncbi:MAG: phenylalanine--tRNA ligase subunit alpha, partial [Anaerovoracaceae bacterium]
MQAQLNKILEEAKIKLGQAASISEADEVRVKLLGKKGQLTEILRGMGKLSPEERKTTGQMANKVRGEIEEILENKFNELKSAAKEAQFRLEKIDVTEPGKEINIGVKHPLTITMEEISKVFMNMGFSIVEGPEVETVFNNFDALNAGPNHPSRDMTDTFYITEDTLLRTQTSPVQVRTLMKQNPPIKVISPGRCFRCDTPDATHSPMFHQIEGLVVDEGITMADLKGTLDSFAKQLFGSSTKTKFRPHHFPFTEPSAEMDVSCFKCGGKGCRVCKGSGWIEILGCGMV